MKRTLFAFVLLVLALHLQAQQLPTVQVTDAHTGKKIAFNETIGKGRVTLISFWATWCAHGKRQVKTIERNLPAWKKQADFNYIAIAVDEQHTEELARTYTRAQGWKFPVYIDANSALKGPLSFFALPYIIIIDKQGKIAFTHTGFDDGSLILPKLKELAGKSTK